MSELIKTILKLRVGKTAKLILAVMSTNSLEKKWLVKEIVEYIGGDAKTVRFSIKELLDQSLIKLVDKASNQANIYMLNHKQIMLFSLHQNDELMIESELIRLSRQAQRHHQKRNILSKQTKKS